MMIKILLNSFQMSLVDETPTMWVCPVNIGLEFDWNLTHYPLFLRPENLRKQQVLSSPKKDKISHQNSVEPTRWIIDLSGVPSALSLSKFFILKFSGSGVQTQIVVHKDSMIQWVELKLWLDLRTRGQKSWRWVKSMYGIELRVW